MKALKNALILGSVFLFGFLATPALAQIESMVGKIIDGPEFVQVIAGPITHYLHKEEVASLTKDPNNQTYNNRFTISLKNGQKFTLTEAQFNYVASQLEYNTVS